MKKLSVGNRIALASLLVTIVACVAAVAVVPEVRQLLNLSSSAEAPTPPTRLSTNLPVQAPTGAPTEEATPARVVFSGVSESAFTDVMELYYARGTDGMIQVWVPGGTFLMGSDISDSSRNDDELPQHSVTLDGFYIDETEVTNTQFARFLNERGNLMEGGVTWLDLQDEDCLIEPVGSGYQPNNGYGDHPVVEVSWYGARAYCEWAGGRLPTEAEWEYSARGPNGHIYPWGNDAPTCELAQSNECSGHTVPVWSLPDGATWRGALDMAGNVWEWVADWYGHYSSGHQVNPEGPSSGENRVIRGGSWDYASDHMRSTIRAHALPYDSRQNVGFRCARDS